VAKPGKGKGGRGGDPRFPIPAKFFVVLREGHGVVAYQDENSNAMQPLFGLGQSQYNRVVEIARDIAAGLNETLRVVEYVPSMNITTIPPGPPRADVRVIDTTPGTVHD
jgi:hypothetical protein